MMAVWGEANGNFIHGEAGSPEYSVWKSAKQRCQNHTLHNFSRYGGRGIRMCDEWCNDFMAFLRDMGRRPSDKHSLDRIDNDGDYEPGNCRWATIRQQAQNRRPPRKHVRRPDAIRAALAEESFQTLLKELSE